VTSTAREALRLRSCSVLSLLYCRDEGGWHPLVWQPGSNGCSAPSGEHQSAAVICVEHPVLIREQGNRHCPVWVEDTTGAIPLNWSPRAPASTENVGRSARLHPTRRRRTPWTVLGKSGPLGRDPLRLGKPAMQMNDIQGLAQCCASEVPQVKPRPKLGISAKSHHFSLDLQIYTVRLGP